MNKSDPIKELATALNKAQSELTAVAKDTKGYGYKYATLDSLIENLRGPLAKHGLSYMQMPSMSDNHVQVETLVMHNSGEWISSTIEAPADDGKQMNAVQGVGSTITYLRRYSLASIFGVPFGADTDGKPPQSSQPRQQRQAPPTEPKASGQQLAALESALSAEYGSTWQDKASEMLAKRGMSELSELTTSQAQKWIDSLN